MPSVTAAIAGELVAATAITTVTSASSSSSVVVVVGGGGSVSVSVTPTITAVVVENDGCDCGTSSVLVSGDSVTTVVLLSTYLHDKQTIKRYQYCEYTTRERTHGDNKQRQRVQGLQKTNTSGFVLFFF